MRHYSRPRPPCPFLKIYVVVPDRDRELQVCLQGVPKKVSTKKLLFGAAHYLNSEIFEFIWIQYICRFCLVYHLKGFGASR